MPYHKKNYNFGVCIAYLILRESVNINNFDIKAGTCPLIFDPPFSYFSFRIPFSLSGLNRLKNSFCGYPNARQEKTLHPYWQGRGNFRKLGGFGGPWGEGGDLYRFQYASHLPR